MVKNYYKGKSFPIYVTEDGLMDKIKNISSAMDYSLSKYAVIALRKAVQEDERKLRGSRIATPESQAAATPNDELHGEYACG